MQNMTEINRELQTRLSSKRYRHSIGVAEEAERLAERYGADEKQAYLAGLIHDCAKEVSESETLRLLKEFGIACDAVALHTPKILHGPLGACIAKRDFQVEDEEVLDAVRYHTTGKAGMSLLAKIIYIADYIEPNRTYPDVEKLRKLTYKDIDAAILFGIDYTIQEKIAHQGLIHPETLECRNDILLCMKK